MNTFLRRRVSLLAGLLAVAFPALVQAHPNHNYIGGWVPGLVHPLTGMDHLLAMVAVGLWAAQVGGRFLWMGPLTFVGFMSAGLALGAAGVSVPWTEETILASVVILGLFVARAGAIRRDMAMAMIALFALAHGLAHGSEIPAMSNGAQYGFGAALATALLHASGVACALFARNMGRASVVRYAGWLIAAAGVWLAVA